MRTALGVLAACSALSLVIGCAHGPKSTTVAPTHDELPQFKELEPTIYAIVGVERRTTQGLVQLVPEFKEPPLTADEKAALGQPKPEYKFLLYPAPGWPAGSHVAPWDGGITAAQYGYGGPETTYGWPTSVARSGGRAGIAVGTDTFGSRVAGAGGRKESMTGVSGYAGVTVDSGPPSRVADHKRRFDR
jgi:hypothetical protein